MKFGTFLLGSGAAALAAGQVLASETITYRYDGRGRLVQAAHNGSVNNGVNTAYGYDRADNRASKATGAGVSVPTPPPPAPPRLSISDAAASEGNALIFTVVKSGSGAASATWSTADGTASAGSDYTAGSGTISFAANETVKTISIPTVNDGVVEPVETMTVALSSPSSGATLGPASGTGSIFQGGATPPVTFSVLDATVTEGGTLVFTVTKAGSTDASFSVTYDTLDNGATAGSDYVAASGTLTFAPNETSKTVSIATIDDSAVEGSESMWLRLLTTTGGAGIADWLGGGTILDNDSAPAGVIQPSNPSFYVLSGSATSFTITQLAALNGASGTITVFTPPSGGGSATIASGGQSVSYTAPTLFPGSPCEPPYTMSYSVPYSITNTATNAVASGTATITVEAPAGSGGGNSCQ